VLAARKHGEVRNLLGDISLSEREFCFPGLLSCFNGPTGLCFEPVLTESGYVQRSEDVVIGSNVALLVWTHNKRLGLASSSRSTHRQITLLSCELNATPLQNGVIIGKSLKVMLQ